MLFQLSWFSPLEPFISESSGSSASQPLNAEMSLSSLHSLLFLFTCIPLNFIFAVSKGTFARQRCTVKGNALYLLASSPSSSKLEEALEEGVPQVMEEKWSVEFRI